MLTTANGTVQASQRGHPARDVFARPSMVEAATSEADDARLVGLAVAFERADHAYLFGPSPASAATTAARDDARTDLARGVRTLAGGRWPRPGSGLLYEIQADGTLLIYTPTVARPAGWATPTRDDAFAIDQMGRPASVLAGPPMKHCPECRTDKRIGKFRMNQYRADGRNELCQMCQDAARRAAPPVLEKRCPDCEETKSRAEFYDQPGARDGLTTLCRVCKRTQVKRSQTRPKAGTRAAT